MSKTIQPHPHQKNNLKNLKKEYFLQLTANSLFCNLFKCVKQDR